MGVERLSREHGERAESKRGGLAEWVMFEPCSESRAGAPRSLTFKEKISTKKTSSRRPGTKKTDVMPLKHKKLSGESSHRSRSLHLSAQVSGKVRTDKRAVILPLWRAVRPAAEPFHLSPTSVRRAGQAAEKTSTGRLDEDEGAGRSAASASAGPGRPVLFSQVTPRGGHDAGGGGGERRKKEKARWGKKSPKKPEGSHRSGRSADRQQVEKRIWRGSKRAKSNVTVTGV